MEELKPSPPNTAPLTPLFFLERAAVVYGDGPSIVYNTTTFTWQQTHRRCLKMASALSALGITRGEVISVAAPNIPAMYELHFAIPMAGAILHTLNTRLDSHTIAAILQHANSKIVFVDCQSESLLLRALSLYPQNSVRPLLVFIGDESGQPTSPNAFWKYYEEMILIGDPDFNWVRPGSEYDPLSLSYTSGTTTSPKGVVHSHRGTFIAAVDALIEWVVPKEPVYLWTLPMFHFSGWNYVWGMAAAGGTNICLRKFDAKTVYDAIDKHRVTHLCGAPVVLNMLCHLNRKPLDTPVQFMTGGAPPSPAILSRAEALGFIVTHIYGMTETGGMVACCTWKKKWEKLSPGERAILKSRQGVKTPMVTAIDVIDPESGRQVARDGKTLGEIVVRGGGVMLGYLKNLDETEKCMKNGWLYTGDVGVMHMDGYLEIKDRSKDVIISGGENVSSVEVESVLYMHPAVNEAAVVAQPHELWGETSCAFLSLKEGLENKPTGKEVMEFCRDRLPGYMVPKTVVFKEELPKTATGKIQKYVLREMARAFGSTKDSKL